MLNLILNANLQENGWRTRDLCLTEWLKCLIFWSLLRHSLESWRCGNEGRVRPHVSCQNCRFGQPIIYHSRGNWANYGGTTPTQGSGGSSRHSWLLTQRHMDWQDRRRDEVFFLSLSLAPSPLHILQQQQSGYGGRMQEKKKHNICLSSLYPSLHLSIQNVEQGNRQTGGNSVICAHILSWH